MSNSFNNGSPYQQSFPPAPTLHNRWIACALALLLGQFGFHNFYLGDKKRGLIQLIAYGIGWLTSFIGIGLVIIIAVHVWAFYEAVMYIVKPNFRNKDGIFFE